MCTLLHNDMKIYKPPPWMIASLITSPPDEVLFEIDSMVRLLFEKMYSANGFSLNINRDHKRRC